MLRAYALPIFLFFVFPLLTMLIGALLSSPKRPKDYGHEDEPESEELTERQRMIQRERRLLTASMRYDVLQRDGFRCQICGATQKDGVLLHVDHIVPVSKGGKTEMSNLRTLCDRCNLGKGDKIEKRIS